ncbi:MAG: ferrous iron transport protein B [Victivallaceae bacterium]|nr:ferrous iron transport protein B [Victivallaceae bacterium]
MKNSIKIALAGNPNCGKTTIFNHLTGTRQHVGNYPGVTVERKTGFFNIGDLAVEVVDLPGVYSLANSSPEEKVAFNELMTGDIDLVLNVIDSGNAQRNLYLTTQLTELDIPMILVFNMIDDATERGLSFNFKMLSGFFGAPIIPTIGSSGTNLEKLNAAISEAAAAETPRRPVKPKYGPVTDMAIHALSEEVEGRQPAHTGKLPPRYFAIKLLENDPIISAMPEFDGLGEEAAKWRDRIAQRNGINSETLMADVRYGVISGACREAITLGNERRRQLSDSIDRFVTNRFLGVPVFLLMMYLVFMFTFSLAEYPMGWIESFFMWCAETISAVWPAAALPFLRRMLIEGVIGGVGGVLIFLPNILLLFLAIAFLEGTGYMARAAFITDGFMHKFGLHGKSFIPMLLGFGCSVPAVMATRTIDNRCDRLTTIMIVPFMSCGARLPIYSMMIPAFFPKEFQAFTMWLLYIIGVVIALLTALLLKSTLFKSDGEVFVMELPPYRMPTLQSILILMWENTAMYLKKAGTVILLASIILFIINSYPEKSGLAAQYEAEIAAVAAQPELTEQDRLDRTAKLRAAEKSEALSYSLAGRIGRGLEVVLKPAGFDWKIGSALIGAFAAKELFVAQLGILYAVGDSDTESGAEHLQKELARSYTPLQAFCIMLFCLLTVPCIATLAAVRKESGSWLFVGAQLALYTTVAYLVALIVFQAGTLLHIGTGLVG